MRKRSAKRASKSRTAQLEQKLDGLITILKTRPDGIDVLSFLKSDGNDSLVESAVPLGHNGPSCGATVSECNSGASDISSSAHSIHASAAEISLDDAERHLHYFRTYMLRYFPFVYLPSTMTARQLYQQRPFFWRCIMAASSKSTAKQVALCESIRRFISESMIMEHNRDLDLLLGLLVFLGWCVDLLQLIPEKNRNIV